MGGSSELFSEAELARFLSAWFAVRQSIQAANFNHFHQAGLSATQFMLLNILPPKGEQIAMGEVARRMNLKPSTIAKTIETLESRRMVKRSKSIQDGRIVLVEITERGQKLQNTALGQFRQHIESAFCEMRATDRLALITGLESFVAALSRE